MHRALLLLPLLCLTASAEEAPLTLDMDVYADVLREVQAERKAAESAADSPAAPATPEAELSEWCLAMQEVGTAQSEVRLILLLQRLNPTVGVEPLAEALELHRLMLAGNARACEQVAAALRSGTLPNGLAFLCAPQLAGAVEERAAGFRAHP